MIALSERLAAAIMRRHELDALARDGQAVPAQLTRAAEEEIRAAEQALLQAATRGGGLQPHELEALHVLLDDNDTVLTDGDGNLWCVIIPEGADHE